MAGEEALTGGREESSTPAAHSTVGVPATATAATPRRAINSAAAATAEYPANAFAVDRDGVLDNATASAAAASVPASGSFPATHRLANLPPVAVQQRRRACPEHDTVHGDAAASTSSTRRRARRPPEHLSDAYLLKNVLAPWVATGATRPGESHVVDICSGAPDELARSYAPTVSEQGGSVWYFLSTVRPKGTTGCWKHKDRMVPGVGSWHTEAGPKKVLDDGRLLGFSQKLSFFRRRSADGGEDVRTGWVLNELHLNKFDQEGGPGAKIEGRALCQMYRSKRGAAKECGAKTEDGGGETAGKALQARGRKRVGALPPAPPQKRVAAADPYDDPPSDDVNFAAPAFDDDERLDAPASWLHCPQCGFHLGALHAVVTPVSSQSEAPKGLPSLRHGTAGFSRGSEGPERR